MFYSADLLNGWFNARNPSTPVLCTNPLSNALKSLTAPMKFLPYAIASLNDGIWLNEMMNKYSCLSCSSVLMRSTRRMEHPLVSHLRAVCTGALAKIPWSPRQWNRRGSEASHRSWWERGGCQNVVCPRSHHWLTGWEEINYFWRSTSLVVGTIIET